MEVKTTSKGTIAIDFDGVINSYKSGFVAIDEIPDPPVPEVFEGIYEYLDAGFEVCIFSTRNGEIAGQIAILNWLNTHGMPMDRINQLKIVSGKPIAKLYIDDRGFQFTGKLPSVLYIESFKPWHGGRSSSQTPAEPVEPASEEEMAALINWRTSNMDQCMNYAPNECYSKTLYTCSKRDPESVPEKHRKAIRAFQALDGDEQADVVAKHLGYDDEIHGNMPY